MKAIVFERYGGPEVLRLAEVEPAAPMAGQVQVRVAAASANPLDWHFMRGEPYLVRLLLGLRRPRSPRLGADLAGTVEAVGEGVTGFKPGDEVFGTARGSFAQFVCAAAKNLARKPAALSFEQAAALPVAAITALQALRDKGRLAAGQRVLVNGAAGGVGHFAVQIAAAMGARVTAVTSTRNVAWVAALGADRVIDYTREDFVSDTAQFDLIVDCVGNRTSRECLRVLKPGGAMVFVGGKTGNWTNPLLGMVKDVALGLISGRRLTGMLAHVDAGDLDQLAAMAQAGKLRPVIDRVYPLEQTAEAIRYLEEGHAQGKVVIRVGSEG